MCCLCPVWAALNSERITGRTPGEVPCRDNPRARRLWVTQSFGSLGEGKGDGGPFLSYTSYFSLDTEMNKCGTKAQMGVNCAMWTGRSSLWLSRGDEEARARRVGVGDVGLAFVYSSV